MSDKRPCNKDQPIPAEGQGKKWPGYCKTILVTGSNNKNKLQNQRKILKDSHGGVKELVFPRALDLDRPKRERTTFSAEQLSRLEEEFRSNQYLVGKDRTSLAQGLGLSETQVKVWFQNRRTKHKKDKEKRVEVGDHSAESQAAQNVLRLLEYKAAFGLSTAAPVATGGAPLVSAITTESGREMPRVRLAENILASSSSPVLPRPFDSKPNSSPPKSNISFPKLAAGTDISSKRPVPDTAALTPLSSRHEPVAKDDTKNITFNSFHSSPPVVPPEYYPKDMVLPTTASFVSAPDLQKQISTNLVTPKATPLSAHESSSLSTSYTSSYSPEPNIRYAMHNSSLTSKENRHFPINSTIGLESRYLASMFPYSQENPTGAWQAAMGYIPHLLTHHASLQQRSQQAGSIHPASIPPGISGYYPGQMLMYPDTALPPDRYPVDYSK